MSEQFFQAIGILRGEVSFDQGRGSIAIAGKEFALQPLPQFSRAYRALQVQAQTQPRQRVIVYPKVTHFPEKGKHQAISFQLVGFDGNGEGISQHLEDGMFLLRGVWQFIPVCRIPCVTVYKNFSRDRLEWVKQSDPAKRVALLRPAHCPVIWKNAPVKPFRYNPKADAQASPFFVQIQASFIPERNCFGFQSLLAPPTTDLPRHMKPAKKDKMKACTKN
ncbi:MAG: hypothetical protein ABEI32_09125 [Halothece sp.]